MDLNRIYLFIAKLCTQVPESRCRRNRIVHLWQIMDESLTLHNGNVCGSLRYNANCITSQALPKAFQAKRNIDVIKAVKQSGKKECQKLIFLNRRSETDIQIFFTFLKTRSY